MFGLIYFNSTLLACLAKYSYFWAKKTFAYIKNGH